MGTDLAQATLGECGWLSLVPASFRNAVLDRVVMRKFGSGDAIYRIGDPPGGLWGLCDGAIQIEIPGSQLGPSLVHFANIGFWFGEGPLIYKSPRRIGVNATCVSTLANLPLADCLELLEEDPGGWHWIALLATMNTDLALGLAADLLLQDPRQRIAAALLRLTGQRTGIFQVPSLSSVSISQQSLGQISNLSRTVVNGIVRDLEERCLVKTHYRGIEILNAGGLKSILMETRD